MKRSLSPSYDLCLDHGISYWESNLISKSNTVMKLDLVLVVGSLDLQEILYVIFKSLMFKLNKYRLNIFHQGQQSMLCCSPIFSDYDLNIVFLWSSLSVISYKLGHYSQMFEYFSQYKWDINLDCYINFF